MKAKSIFSSKTFWFNALALVVAVSGAYGFTGELGEGLKPFVVPIVTLLNIALRYVTKQPVALSG